MRAIRIISWAAVVVIGLAVVAFNIARQSPTAEQKTVTESVAPLLSAGGTFTAKDHKGKTFTEKNIHGKPALMFFGFTYCPNICPTTLSRLTDLMEKLGPDANKINVIFVSVDPERDTIEQMANYLSVFDKRIIGLTLTPTNLEDMSKKYHFYYKKVPIDKDNYTMDHTAGVYAFDTNGNFGSIIDLHEPGKVQIDKIRLLLKEPA